MRVEPSWVRPVSLQKYPQERPRPFPHIGLRQGGAVSERRSEPSSPSEPAGALGTVRQCLWGKPLAVATLSAALADSRLQLVQLGTQLAPMGLRPHSVREPCFLI